METLGPGEFFVFQNKAYMQASRVTEHNSFVLCPFCVTKVGKSGRSLSKPKRHEHQHSAFSYITQAPVEVGSYEQRSSNCGAYAQQELERIRPNSQHCGYDGHETDHLIPAQYVFVVTSKTKMPRRGKRKAAE
jgi:hypothetical protein